MSTRDSSDKKVEERKSVGFLHAPIRFLLGYDVFIGYARSDADAYAEMLEAKLESLGLPLFATSDRSTSEIR